MNEKKILGDILCSLLREIEVTYVMIIKNKKFIIVIYYITKIMLKLLILTRHIVIIKNVNKHFLT